MIRASIGLLLFLGSASAAEIHYAPVENLERIDVDHLDDAEHTIDFAGYVLSDWPVIEALLNAGTRGVKVRVYVDGSQAGQPSMSPDGPFGKLFEASNVEIREKHPGKPIMHLKAYCIDGRLFRTGSANFSASGLKQQDNDLILFDDPALCGAFEADFDRMWTGKDAE